VETRGRALIFESDRVAHVFPAEAGQVRVVVAMPAGLVSGEVTVADEEGRVSTTLPITSTSRTVNVDLPTRGYYAIATEAKFRDGFICRKRTSAAVIGPPIPDAQRMRSCFGTQYNSHNLGTLAGARWLRSYILPGYAKYHKAAKAGFPVPAGQNQPRAKDTMIWCLINQPAWLQDRSKYPEGGGMLPMKDRKLFRELLRYIIRTYPTKIECIESCNEPGGKWRGTMQEFVDYHADITAAAHSIDPSIRVIGPSICGLDPPRMQFLRKLVDKGLLNNITGLAIHAYVNAMAPEGDFIERIRMLKRYLASVGKPDMPIYVTEYGWTIPPGDWQSPVEPVTQARYCARSLILLQTEGIEAIVWFKLASGHTLKLPASGYGLTNPDYTPRPSYAAFANTVRCLTGADGPGKVLRVAASTYLALFGRKDRTVAVAWDAAGRSEVFLPPPWVAARDMMGRPLPAGKDGIVTVNGSPVFVELPGRGFRDMEVRKPIRVIRGRSASLPFGPTWAPKPLAVREGRLIVPGDTPAGQYLLLGRQEKAWQAAPVEVVTAVEVVSSRVAWPARRAMPEVRLRLRSHLDGPATVRVAARFPGLRTGDVRVPLQIGAVADTAVPLEGMTFGKRYRGHLRIAMPGPASTSPVLAPLDVTILPCTPAGKPSQAMDISAWGPVVPATSSRDSIKPADCSATLQASYDDTGLHLLVVVRDDEHVTGVSPVSLWMDDCIQVGFDMDADQPWQANAGGASGHFRVFEYGAALGKNGPMAFRWISHYKPLASRSMEPRVKANVTRVGDRTRYEVTFPWVTLGLTERPAAGTSVGFSLVINDRDAPRSQPQGLRLFGGIADSKDPRSFGRLWMR
jgi:hypothetical protein